MIKHSKVKSIFILTLTSKVIILGSLLSYENTAPTESVENKSVNEQVCIQQETSEIDNKDLPPLQSVSIATTSYLAPAIEMAIKTNKEDATTSEEEMEDTKTTSKIETALTIEEEKTVVKKYIQGWTNTNANVREGASSKTKALDVYSYNTEVEYTDYNEEWVEIKYKDGIAYIYKKLISKEKNPEIKEEEKKQEKQEITYSYSGSKLTKSKGINQGPSGGESYYNLPMDGVIQMMENLGYSETYWIREDGCKMYGDYIIVAADTRDLPRGTIIETSLGTAMVCDHCGYSERYDGIWLDIAVDWK